MNHVLGPIATRWRARIVPVLACVAATALLFPAPSRAGTASAKVEVSSAAAPHLLDQSYYTAIQPGAPVKIYPGEAYSPELRDSPFGVCTLNFVFRGREAKPAGQRASGKVHTYIGDAGHCLRAVGQRVASPEIGEFGTVAFRLSCRLEPCEGRPREDDFGLIRIDEDKVHLVNPAMRGFGQPPT